jgi:hypothetical protein
MQVHAPVNGSEAYASGVPDGNFTFTLSNNKGYSATIPSFFQVPEVGLESWNFTWYEDLFARDSKSPTPVNVASKAYRSLELYEPGEYTGTLRYWDQETVVRWTVHEPKKQLVKNVILFIGDGMPQSAVSYRPKSGSFVKIARPTERSYVVDHRGQADRAQTDQREIPIHHAIRQDGSRSPNDPFPRFVHHRFRQFRYRHHDRSQEYRQCSRRLRG